MIVDQAGELIADIMTANRSLSSIPSASAILDTSNYTFHAISYGKDADGFRNHAHTILSPSGDSRIKVVSYGSMTFSGYNTSTTAFALSESYKIYPKSPLPLDTSLESKSTLPIFSAGLTDFGQCLNSIIDSNASIQANSNTIGCYPAATGTVYCIVSSAANALNSVIVSGSLSGGYNGYNIMDKNGFLTFYDGPASSHYICSSLNVPPGIGYLSGALRIPPTTNPKSVVIQWILPYGDAGSLLLFGGVYHIGLWYLDLKQLLKDGYYPPFNFNSLNNIRKYKLFAKKTFNRNLITIQDISSGNRSGFKELFERGYGWTGSNNQYFLTLTWELKFA